ncbi:MAG: Cell division protein FtsA [Clostridia bacterium 41_269]|nr:MAG: Cell division protein FtsA [Clostridia bacterium 41_269]
MIKKKDINAARRKILISSKLLKLIQTINAAGVILMSQSGEASEVFALDIGTRTVIGLVGTVCKNSLKIKAAEIEEHRNRSMVDGQIHNIEEVAELVKKIKKNLEKKCGCTLTKVSVAAAGRALKTIKGTAERKETPLRQLTSEDVIALEIQGVENALKSITEEIDKNKESSYYCVGYSVVQYLLDGNPIGSLVGQRANSISVEIIATFLPRVVVDSLYSVLDAAGLELESITLEPIAASTVVIPENMRKLNIALLDVGAGTTDIAVSSSGSMIGYGMVPCAGDEVTEAICSEYLVDFDTGEKIKRSLSPGKKVKFQNILGTNCEVSSEEIASCYEGVLEELAEKVKENLIEINGKIPQAVICIGGGSLTFGFADVFARVLGLPRERIAVKGREVLHEVKGAKNLKGPQAVTPIGIAVASQSNKALEKCKVFVNGMPVIIFKEGEFTVADALLSCGLKVSDIYGKPGKGIAVEVNGQVQFIKGKKGEPGKIFVNGEEAFLEKAIKSGDKIQFIPAKHGEEARARVEDILDEVESKTVKINGKEYVLDPVITVNGKLADKNTLLSDNDRIFIKKYDTLKEILEFIGKDYAGIDKILINGKAAELNSSVMNGDEIEFYEKNADEDKKGDEDSEKINIVVNGRPYTLSYYADKKPIFSDVFSLIKFKTTPPTKNSRLIMLVNGNQAKFTQSLNEGDQIILKWEEIKKKFNS